MTPIAIMLIAVSILAVAAILLRNKGGYNPLTVFICMLIIVFLDSAFVFQRFRAEDYGPLNWAVLGLGASICFFFSKLADEAVRRETDEAKPLQRMEEMMAEADIPIHVQPMQLAEECLTEGSFHMCPQCGEAHTNLFCPAMGGKVIELIQRNQAQECPGCNNARRDCTCPKE